MKKLLVYAPVLFAVAVMFSSCKKDYTCECTVNGTPVKVELNNQKKKTAEDNCDAAETTYRMGDSGASCELK